MAATKLLPKVQAGPYLWEVNDPAQATPWTNPWRIGVVEDAPEEEWNPAFDEIRGDNLGDTIQDTLFRGANLFISMVVQEFGTEAYRLLQPYYNRDAVPNDLNQAYADGGMASVGMLTLGTTHSNASQVASFRLRATALHPNMSTMVPYQIYFNSITLAPNQPATFQRGTRLKNVGVRLMCFPEHLYMNQGSPDPVSGTPDTTQPLVFAQTIQAAP